MADDPYKEEHLYGVKLPLKKRKELRQKIKSHDFAGHRYKIIWKKPEKDAWGLCEDNSAPEKTMHVSPNLKEYDFLSTCLDEAIHACNFSLSNDHVDEMASSIGYFLWRVGFRLEGEE
jgi:hypothetical protein